MSQAQVPATPQTHGANTYQASRSPDHNGAQRWTIFRVGQFTPAGFLQEHQCADYPGETRLLVFDGNGAQLGTVESEHQCVGAYHNALTWLEVDHA